MADYCWVYGVIHFTSPAGWLPVHRDQLRAQRSVTSMGKLYLYLFAIVNPTQPTKNWNISTQPDPWVNQTHGQLCRILYYQWRNQAHSVEVYVNAAHQ